MATSIIAQENACVGEPRLLSISSSIGSLRLLLLLAMLALPANRLWAWQTAPAAPGYYGPQPSYSNRPAIDPRSMPYSAAAEVRPEQVTPYGPIPGPPRKPQPSYRPDDWPSSTVSDMGGPAGPPPAGYRAGNAVQDGQ